MFRLIFLKIGWILSIHWLPPVVLTVTTARFACRLDFNHPPASAGGSLAFCANRFDQYIFIRTYITCQVSPIDIIYENSLHSDELSIVMRRIPNEFAEPNGV